MVIANIRDRLLVQQRELALKLKEPYVERKLDVEVFKKDIIKVIIGPRRAGKSFFAINTLKDTGNFGYVNFDDEVLINTTDYDDLINNVNSVYNNPRTILFDEIQNLDKWELFVNRLQRLGYNIIITGSNSKLLSKELATHLTGRHLQVNVFPFSFREFLKLDKRELTESEIKVKLSEYLKTGGFPEPYVKGVDFKEYLSTLFNSVLYNDVVKRFKIKSPQAIDDLATYLISNIANEFSYNSLTKVSMCKSAVTVEKYLSYLEETFLIFTLKRFSYKVKEQIKSNKKVYCIDNGLVYAKAFQFSEDIGKLYENAVAIELKKMEFKGNLNLYYWKNVQNEEVDFVVKTGSNIKGLIQVCYDLSDPKVKNREVRALLKASADLGCKNLFVITGDYEEEKLCEWAGVKEKIKFIPLWKWLSEVV